MKSSYLLTVLTGFLLLVGSACDQDSPTVEPLETEDFVAADYHEAADVMPKIIGGIESVAQKIKYPESAKNDKVEGTVFLHAYVDTGGNVAHIEVAKGVRDDLDRAAIEAVKQVKFEPGLIDNTPVGVRVTFPIQFRLPK